MPARARTIAFVASCLNEAGNVAELHRRCLAAFEDFTRQNPKPRGWTFAMTLADNGSTDGTAEALLAIRDKDPRLQVLINARNYGPEPSVISALKATNADIYILLASDLQDPPELVPTLLKMLTERSSSVDAVLACKRSLPQGTVLNLGRLIYYRLLEFGTRSQRAPNGFHGFGAYRAEVIQDATELWRNTPMVLRQALAKSSQEPRTLTYELLARYDGKSSYRVLDYVREGLEAVCSGDAITTRLTMRMGIGALTAAFAMGVAVIVNVARGTSGYVAGTPTLMLLILISLGIQALMLSMLSFQIENLHLPIKRPAVRTRRMEGNNKNQSQALEPVPHDERQHNARATIKQQN